MVKITVILLQIILAAITGLVNGESNVGQGFTYIGSYPAKPQNYDVNKYYLSNTATTWSVAEEDCANMFGTNAALLAIDTIAEWEFLRIVLEQYGSGTTYWTSGMYDFTTSVWRWSSNNQPIPPYPPWGPGYPLTPITSAHRILIWHTNRYDAYWRTGGDTVPTRYICKMKSLTC